MNSKKTGGIQMNKYLHLIRVRHYIKNVLILLPLVFSGLLFEKGHLIKGLLGFAAFSFISSVVYIINDIRDADSDRKHPKKCKRPIASGEISVRNAFVTAGSLFCLAVAAGLFASGSKYLPWLYLALYFVLNLLYSFGLKNVPVADIAILVSGFLLRVLYGSSITGIEISKWLYLTVIAMSFYLGLGKRRNELEKHGGESTRKVLEAYNKNFLDKNMYMCMALGICFYSLWTVDSLTVSRIGNDNLIWTVPIVILICLKYSLSVEGNSDGDPVEVILHDKVLCAMVLILALIMLAVIYL